MSDKIMSPTQYDAVTHNGIERVKAQSDYLV